jgi:hypothetical protein
MSDSGYAPSETSYWIPTLLESQLGKYNTHKDHHMFQAHDHNHRNINTNPMIMMDSAKRKTTHVNSHQNQLLSNGFTQSAHNNEHENASIDFFHDTPVKHINAKSVESVRSLGSNTDNAMIKRNEQIVADTGIAGIQSEHNNLPIGFGGWSPTKSLPPVAAIARPNDGDDVRRKVLNGCTKK